MRKKAFFVWLALVVLSCQGFGNPVGFNITDGSAIPSMAGKTADGCSIWTDAASATGTARVLDGTDGLVTVDWHSSNLWYHGPYNTEEEQLYRHYADDGDPITVTFYGLYDWVSTHDDAGAYTIRIYQNTDWGDNTFPPITITDGVNLLTTVQAPEENYNRSNGARAFVDSGLLTADSVVLTLRLRDLGARQRSTFSAAKVTLLSKFIPVNPYPEVGTEAPINQIVSWEQLARANNLGVTYNVYFGTDANDLSPAYYGLNPVKTTTDNAADFFYDPGILDNGVTYYWRVDAIDPNDGSPAVHKGPEWWFTTPPASPQVKTDPGSRIVALGESSVEFSVSGINIETYQWYKDGAALPDDPTDTLYTGQDTATLTIYDVQIEDEGEYYCVVDNVLQQPDTSAAARLTTRRLVGWWKLDGDLTDSITEMYAGALAHDGVAIDPNFALGKDGSALEFSGNPGDLVAVPGTVDYLGRFLNGFTVSAWVKMPFKGGGSWETFVSNEGVHPDNSRSGFMLSVTGTGVPMYTLRESFGDMKVSPDLDDNKWHLFVATYDGVTKRGAAYVDGVLRAQTTHSGTLRPSPADLLFGAQTPTATVYTGLLDDVRIYSYAADEFEIAKLYTDFNPGTEICVVNPTFDVAGPNGVGSEHRDCRVDLYDFAVFAKDWLGCNVVPTCLH